VAKDDGKRKRKNAETRVKLCGSVKADLVTREFKKITALLGHHFKAAEPKEPIDFQQEAGGWYRKHKELSKTIKTCFSEMGFKVPKDRKALIKKLDACFNWQEFESDEDDDSNDEEGGDDEEGQDEIMGQYEAGAEAADAPLPTVTVNKIPQSPQHAYDTRSKKEIVEV
jgi:hypothetical protein